MIYLVLASTSYNCHGQFKRSTITPFTLNSNHSLIRSIVSREYSQKNTSLMMITGLSLDILLFYYNTDYASVLWTGSKPVFCDSNVLDVNEPLQLRYSRFFLDLQINNQVVYDSIKYYMKM